MFTITTRLTLRYLLIFGTIVSAIVVVMYTVFESNERDSFDAELRDYAEFLVSGVNTSTGSVSDMFDNLQDVTGQANLRFRSKWFLLMTRDSVVYESGQQDSIEDMVDSLQTMLPNRGRPKFRTIQANGITYRAFALSIPNTQKLRLGIVVVGSLDRLEATLERLRNILLIIVPASLLLAGVGGWFTARRALAPVAEITSAAAAISSSNLHQRVSGGNSTDELAQLASTFNAMIERLELTFNSQRRFVADASHELRTPLTT
ncbi:MAG: HAMP domain-containing protein, partial [Bacteroidota bacterium]